MQTDCYKYRIQIQGRIVLRAGQVWELSDRSNIGGVCWWDCDPSERVASGKECRHQAQELLLPKKQEKLYPEWNFQEQWSELPTLQDDSFRLDQVIRNIIQHVVPFTLYCLNIICLFVVTVWPAGSKWIINVLYAQLHTLRKTRSSPVHFRQLLLGIITTTVLHPYSGRCAKLVMWLGSVGSC